ncbi:MAG TPA: ABC transporter permease [Pyrinomonadaceae bacterium]|jgi:NitT/TauT family transport system permease protein
MAIRQPIPRRLYVAAGAAAFLFVFALWSLLSYTELVAPYFLPPPHRVLLAIVELFTKYNLLTDIAFSFYRVSLGFLMAAALGVPVGILMGSFKLAEAFIEPLNDFIRYMPVPAFIPLVILWIGIGNSSQITLIFIGVFFQLTIMVADTVAHVPKEYLEISCILGHNNRQIIRRVIVPASLPGIFDALRVGVGWAWSYLILAEVVAASVGLGHMIMESQRYLRTANVIAGIIIIGIIGLVIDYVFKVAHRRLFRWSEKEASS